MSLVTSTLPSVPVPAHDDDHDDDDRGAGALDSNLQVHCDALLRSCTTTTVSLLDLPHDILANNILSPGINDQWLGRTDLISLACTCKAAAALALPRLYCNLLVPSLASLPVVFQTLSTRPDLAHHVHTLTVSRYFIESAEFDLVTDALRRCKVLLSPSDNDAPPSSSSSGTKKQQRKPKPAPCVNTLTGSEIPGLRGPSPPASPSNLISAVTSVTHAHRRCDPTILANLPMAWFTRIARVCPNLRVVDLSHMPHLTGRGGLCVPMVFGFLDLAQVLRPRQGVFKSAPHTPVSAVIVLEDSRHQGKHGPEVYFVTAIDWAKRQLDISGIVAMGFDFPLDYPLVPFSDLDRGPESIDTAATAEDEPPSEKPPPLKTKAKQVPVTNPNKPSKAKGNTTATTAVRANPKAAAAKAKAKAKVKVKKWTIHHALVQIQNAKTPRPWADWLHSARDLWLHFGIRKGVDPVFDFSRPGTFQGSKVSFNAPVIRYAKAMLEERHIRASAQVDEYVLEGLDPKHMAMQEATKDPKFESNKSICIYDFDHLHSSLFSSLTKLVVSSAFFINTVSLEHVCSQMALGLPNLVDLAVLQVQIPIDMVLGMLDMLTRRTPDRGKPLRDLRVTMYIPPPAHQIRAVNSPWPLPANVDSALARIRRTPLHATRATLGHLRSVCIEAGGHGLSEPHEHWDLPMVAVHPGILHGVHELRMFKLKMFIVPPTLARHDSPSFVPVSAVLDGLRSAAITHRTLLFLGNVTLRSLLVHGTGAHCLFPPTRTPPPVPSRCLLSLLPTCPNLYVLHFANDELDDAIPLAALTRLLDAHPRLVSLTLSYTSLARADLAALARRYVVPPPTSAGDPRVDRILYPCPRLREVELMNTQARTSKDRGNWVSVTHVSDLPRPPAAATAAKGVASSLEREVAARMDFTRLLGGPFSSTTGKCPACGLLIEKRQHTRPAMEFAQRFAGMVFGEDAATLMQQRLEEFGQDVGADAEGCSRCGPRSFVVARAAGAAGAEKTGTAKGKVAGAKMWMRVSSTVQPYMEDLV